MTLDPVWMITILTTIGSGCIVWLVGYLYTHSLRWQHHLQLQLLHNCPVGLCYLDQDRVQVNKTFCLMWNLSHKPHTFRQLISYLSENEQLELTEKALQLQQNKTPFDLTIHKDKQTFHVRGRSFESRKSVLWFSDISPYLEKVQYTQHKTDVITKQLDLLQSAWENFPNPTYIRDINGKVIFANQAVADKEPNDLNQLHWINQSFHSMDKDYTLTYGQETRTEEEVQSLFREVGSAHSRLCRELPCPICLFNAAGKLIACSPAFAKLWQLDNKWLNTQPDYENFWDTLQEKGLLSRVMDFSKYKKGQREQFAELTQTQELFLYLPDGKIIRRLMIPFAQGGVILLDEDKTI